MTHIVSGILIILAGLYLFICGRLKRKETIYSLLVARSRILWKDKVHGFHQVAGVMMIIFGIMVAAGVFKRLF